MKLDDMSYVEVNEAFAAQYLAVEKVLGLNREVANVNGGLLQWAIHLALVEAGSLPILHTSSLPKAAPSTPWDQHA